MSLFIIGTKFFKISVNLRCDLCMKKQLDQLTAYTPGLSPESLKKQYGIKGCLLYTSPSPRDKRQSRMPSSA